MERDNEFPDAMISTSSCSTFSAEFSHAAKKHIEKQKADHQSEYPPWTDLTGRLVKRLPIRERAVHFSG